MFGAPGDRRRIMACFLFILFSLLPACAPNKALQITPPVKMPTQFSREGVADLAGRWWKSFGDSGLNDLVESALQNNFSLRAAWNRLDQARAVARANLALLLPSLDGSGSAGRSVEKFAGRDRVYQSNYTLGLKAAYEIDLWGRLRSDYDAARLDMYATQEDVQTAALTLSAGIAQTWFRLIEQRIQQRLIRRQLEINERHLEIITTKFRRGQVSATDVLQERELVEATKGDLALVASNIEVLEHQLAALLGRPPGEMKFEVPDSLPMLPPLPRTGVPADLIRRRPDVRAAELRVQAADRRVAAAIADRFPKLSLTAGSDTTAEQVRDLFDNWLAGLAANLAAPLFDGGRRRAEVERSRALAAERLNAYGQTILTALKEVEDALAQERRQAEYVASLERQLELSNKSIQQIFESYTKGAADFTRYLTTLLAHQQLQRKYVSSKRDLLLYRVDLYRALSGGWKLSRPPRSELPGPPNVSVSSP